MQRPEKGLLAGQWVSKVLCAVLLLVVETPKASTLYLWHWVHVCMYHLPPYF